MKYARKDYLDGKCTHREYYGQFVDGSIRETVLHRIGGAEYLREKLFTDDNLNNIPLVRWDNLPGPMGINAKMAEAGDYLTLSGKVCIYKEAARQIAEGL